MENKLWLIPNKTIIMAENSKIEWCDHTVNLWWGCSKVHTGCKNCYAENTSKRFGINVWGENTSRGEVKSSFKDLDKYQTKALETGRKQVIFCGSMMDIFEEAKPMIYTTGEPILSLGNHPVTTDKIRNLLFDLITRGKFPDLIFLFLTKRPGHISGMIPNDWNDQTPKNVWFGSSISDQETADELVPALLNSTPPNTNLFLSVEPQVGPIDLKKYYLPKGRLFADDKDWWLQHINWVIQGGESGINRRPFDIAWAKQLQKQCKEAVVPYFFKQIDKITPVPEELHVRQFPFGENILKST